MNGKVKENNLSRKIGIPAPVYPKGRYPDFDEFYLLFISGWHFSQGGMKFAAQISLLLNY